jgi:Zn-finger nucleic acid-binding protein
MEYNCPDCSAPLDVVAANGARVLSCPSCRGRLYGLSPFERMLSEGVGARVWTGAATGAPAGPCPYCTAAMHRPDGDPDAPPGAAVCRACQEVWVPAGAADWMAAHGAAGPAGVAAAATAPSECSNCGAPYRPDDDGRCHWCHSQIAAPAPVVLVMQPEPQPDWGLRLI